MINCDNDLIVCMDKPNQRHEKTVNKIYEKICGSREDVWNCKAYKTSGGLTKNDLILNKYGKIVSKKKCIQETSNNRFEKYGINCLKAK